MSVEYLELADYLAIAVEVTRLSVDTITRVANLDLADSALHAPAAGFGDTEFYPDFIDKAAVLIVRLAKNHPLPDGNKRTAWVALRVFVDLNGWDLASHVANAITGWPWSRWSSAIVPLTQTVTSGPPGRGTGRAPRQPCGTERRARPDQTTDGRALGPPTAG